MLIQIKGILIFVIGAILLHLAHHCFVWWFKGTYAFKIDGNPDVFRPNRAYQFIESCFIFLNVLYAYLIPEIVCRESHYANVVTGISIIMILAGSIQSAIDINKKSSFFKFSESSLKWNLAFRNPLAHTVKIELKDIDQVGERTGYVIVRLKDGKEYKISKYGLELLNGFKLLKKQLLDLDS